MIAAWVDGEPIDAAEVEAEVDRLRSGPLADRLPPAGTADARQLRRWVTQRVVLGRLLEHEAADRGLPAPSTTIRPDASVLGAAAADVLLTSAAARAVLATFATRPTGGAVRAHYDAHPDRYARGERWLAREAFAPTPDALVLGPPTELDPATLVPELRGRPTGPVPYEQVRPEIEVELAARATQHAFARWLDESAARRITLAPGFEHPADPRQPDATHRH